MTRNLTIVLVALVFILGALALLVPPKTSVTVSGSLSQDDVIKISWMIRAHALSRPALFSEISFRNLRRFPAEFRRSLFEQPTEMIVSQDGTVEVKTSGGWGRFTATNGPSGWSWWNAYP